MRMMFEPGDVSFVSLQQQRANIFVTIQSDSVASAMQLTPNCHVVFTSIASGERLCFKAGKVK